MKKQYNLYSPQPLLASRGRLHDTCGVHNLHGMPAIIAAIVGAVYCAVATEEVYGPRSRRQKCRVTFRICAYAL